MLLHEIIHNHPFFSFFLLCLLLNKLNSAFEAHLGNVFYKLSFSWLYILQLVVKVIQNLHCCY